VNQNHNPASRAYEKYDVFRKFLQRKCGRAPLPSDMDKLIRDRLPAWIEEIPKNARILDAGCAEGYLLEALSRVGYKNLTGLDLSENMLEIARKRLPPDIKLIRADILPWIEDTKSNSFDVIFFNQVLEHIPREDTIKVLREFHRVLTFNGRISISVPNMASLIGSFTMAIDFSHLTHFTENSLFQVLVMAGFDANSIEFISQAPRLFWSWRNPHKALLRMLNRIRWHINHFVHWIIYYVLLDFPYAHIFDPSLVVVAKKSKNFTE